MKRDDILTLIMNLAMSQGFYDRLLNALNENPEQGEEWLAQVEEMNFHSALEFILWLEG